MKHCHLHKFLFTICIFLANHVANAYNPNNSLVQTYDTLTVFDETNTEVGSWRLTSFPYIDGVNKNFNCCDYKFFVMSVVDDKYNDARIAMLDT